MGKYLWCEDRKSGYQFWCAICKELYPDIKVESKNSNSELRKAVMTIAADENQYYILMDIAIDNPDVLREVNQLKKETMKKDNVHIIHIHSFEVALLSFELLEQWVFAEKDDLKDSRREFLQARTLLNRVIYSEISASELENFRETCHCYSNKNIEQIAAKLLFEITRNTGFETNKSVLGKCFVNNCCEWNERQADDICGLDKRRISASEKVKILVERSILKKAFEGM